MAEAQSLGPTLEEVKSAAPPGRLPYIEAQRVVDYAVEVDAKSLSRVNSLRTPIRNVYLDFVTAGPTGVKPPLSPKLEGLVEDFSRRFTGHEVRPSTLTISDIDLALRCLRILIDHGGDRSYTRPESEREEI